MLGNMLVLLTDSLLTRRSWQNQLVANLIIHISNLFWLIIIFLFNINSTFEWLTHWFAVLGMLKLIIYDIHIDIKYYN